MRNLLHLCRRDPLSAVIVGGMLVSASVWILVVGGGAFLVLVTLLGG